MVLIFILAYAGVKIWYNRLENVMLSSPPAETVVQTVPEGKKVEIRRKSDDYQIIIDRNIFGAVLEKSEEKLPTQPVEEELQPTKLKLSLMGTVSGTSKDTRAIISDDTSRKQDIYAVGDSVQGALIKVIERRRVVLRVNGKDEVLDIKEREGGPVETSFSQAPEHEVRRPNSNRLNARRPIVRPSPRNRPLPGIMPPIENEGEETGIGDITEPEENSDEPFVPDKDQLEDAIDGTDQEPIEEPAYIDNEPLDQPGI
jgi:hypothetical protein